MLEQPVTWDCVKHGAAPQGPLGAGGRVPVVEVEQVVVRHQLQPDGHVVRRSGSRVHERDLGRGHELRAAVVGRVARVGDQRQLVRAELVTGAVQAP